MSAEFHIDVDSARNLVRITMSGFYSAADIEAFLVAREAAHRRLACAPNAHLTLNDLRGMKIQSQDAVVAFRRLLADPAYRSRRLAFVIDRTLARAQLERALADRDARCFSSCEEAEAWLLEGRVNRAA